MTGELRYRGAWLAVGWCLIAAAWVGSLVPGPELRELHAVPDKLQHAAVYFILMLWFAGVYSRRSLARVGIALFLMGCAVELAQGAFTSTREMDWRDALANTVGIAIALAAAYAGAAGWAARIERLLGVAPGSP